MQLKMSCHNMYRGWATTARGQHRAPINYNARFFGGDKVTPPHLWGVVKGGGYRAEIPPLNEYSSDTYCTLDKGVFWPSDSDPPESLCESLTE